jgi:hypothetical protein
MTDVEALQALWRLARSLQFDADGHELVGDRRARRRAHPHPSDALLRAISSQRARAPRTPLRNTHRMPRFFLQHLLERVALLDVPSISIST